MPTACVTKALTISQPMKHNLTTVFSIAIVLTFLFHRSSWGLNVTLFQLGLMLFLYFSGRLQLTGSLIKTLTLSTILSAIAVTLINSYLAICINLLVFGAFLGALHFPAMRSTMSTLGVWLTNFVLTHSEFFSALGSSHYHGFKLKTLAKRFAIFILPLLVIGLFVIIYRTANPVFNDYAKNLATYINDGLANILGNWDAVYIFTFILSLFVANQIVFTNPNTWLSQLDANAKDVMLRERPKWKSSFKPGGLRNQNKSGIFLLATLNLLLLMVNVIDINWVWLNFTWNGAFLKQFVHEGTYLLIISILISIAVVLFFFKGNLNFFSKNTWLKYLSYIWLAQNAILASSVAMRNIWYIHYYSLAYKRIGVFIFLLITIFGLFAVLVKVKKRKTTFWLFKVNSLAILIILLFSSFVNWDLLIARYNIKHAGKSFLHLDFMAHLSNKTLPYLTIDSTRLTKVLYDQQNMFKGRVKYMDAAEYHERISLRTQSFLEEYPQRKWQEWNLPDYLAHKKLRAEK